MYIDKNIVYSDPGKYLKYNNTIGFQFPDAEGIMEYDLIIDDIYKVGTMAYYNGGTLAQLIFNNGTYGDYKSAIIKKRYSNDDQIAIILNKEDSDDDKIRYDRMMQWRDFAAKLSRKMVSL